MYELKVGRTNGIETTHFLSDEWEAKLVESELDICQNVEAYLIIDMLTGEVVKERSFER